jgi:hypothetical protein
VFGWHAFYGSMHGGVLAVGIGGALWFDFVLEALHRKVAFP